ncbi:MAG: hypothetical protein IPF95_12675 [Flavobacteriales bacterium]|nr:hypothetical protein [Flavobacteriales bacterium]MBK6945859.1 hypothetical protein [Flavobacteriales bacterium]MBK9536685.1 hypothetical protein [Flavobacteriales bacterium]MBP9139173.1 hypothetical protein [Flavobacteriales bacterium]HQV53255.1 hypothetical protein [Flavobacteriales bacterium]
MRILLLALLVVLGSSVSAAHLRVYGLVTELEGNIPMSGVMVKVYKDGERLKPFYTGANGKYNVDLDNGAYYVIRFVKDGRVTKCFSVDTHGGEWQGDGKEVSLEIGIIMFEPVSGMDLSFFDMPMGMANFMPLNGQILWSKEYESKVAPQVQRLMTERASRLAFLATNANQSGNDFPRY